MNIKASRYIEILPSYKCPKTFVEGVKKGIETTGRSGQKTIKVQELKYVLAEKASDLFPRLKGVAPRGWPDGTTWDQAGALSRDGTIGCFSNLKLSHIPARVRHETGHELDRSFRKIIGRIFTNTEGYTDAYLKDLSKLRERLANENLNEKNIQYLIQQSTLQKATEGGKTETFAEIYAKLRGGCAIGTQIKNFDKIIDRLFPNTVAYVKKLLWLLGDK